MQQLGLAFFGFTNHRGQKLVPLRILGNLQVADAKNETSKTCPLLEPPTEGAYLPPGRPLRSAFESDRLGFPTPE